MTENSTSNILSILSKTVAHSKNTVQNEVSDSDAPELKPTPGMDEVLAHILNQSMSKKNTPLD